MAHKDRQSMENFCKNGKLEVKNGYEVCREEDRRGELRYDLTKLFPGRQTAGHYHFGGEPELYEVQSGQAVFLTQSRNGEKTYAIEAKKGEKVVILPYFSMRTINPSKGDDLVISNWVNDKVKNDYNAFSSVPEAIKLRPNDLPQELENLEFLSSPEKYQEFLTIEKLYERI